MFGYLELFSGADKDLIGKFFSEHACQCILDHPDLAPVGGDNTDVFGRDQAIGPEQFLDVVLNVVDLQCVVEGGGQTVLGVLANHAVEHDWTVGVLDPVEIPKELGGRFVGTGHQCTVVELFGWHLLCYIRISSQLQMTQLDAKEKSGLGI